MKTSLKIASLLILCVLASCGGSSDESSSTAAPATSKGKCMTDYPLNGQHLIACAEVENVTEDQLAIFDTVVCNNTQLPGTYTASELCPTTGVISTCELTVVALDLPMKIKYYADHNEVTAAMDCTERKKQASQK